MKNLIVIVTCLSLLPQLIQAQQIDEFYNQKIKEYTTDERFLPASVLNIVDDQNVPSPLKYFGEIIGSPGVMHRTTDIYNYFKLLSEKSPFLSIEQLIILKAPIIEGAELSGLVIMLSVFNG